MYKTSSTRRSTGCPLATKVGWALSSVSDINGKSTKKLGILAGALFLRDREWGRQNVEHPESHETVQLMMEEQPKGLCVVYWVSWW